MFNHIIRIFFWGLLVLIGVAAIYSLKLLFLPLIVSVLLTFLLQPVVNFFESRGMHRLVVICGLYLVTIAFFAGLLVFIVPRFLVEAKSLAVNFPLYEQTFQKILGDTRAFISEKLPFLKIPDLYQYVRNWFYSSGFLVNSVSSMASGFFTVLSLLVLIPVVTFFLLADGHLLQKALLRMVPNRYFEMFILLFHKISKTVEHFIRGQLIDASAVGIMTMVGLAILGIPNFLLIGIIAGLGNIIPYLGPVIGFLPAFFLMMVSPEGLTVLGLAKIGGLFVVVQFIESNFIYPVAVGKSVDLHPLLVILGITVGGSLGGVIGMLIAVPLISILKVTIEVLFTYLRQYSIL